MSGGSYDSNFTDLGGSGVTQATIVCSTNPPSPHAEGGEAWHRSIQPLLTLATEMQRRKLDVTRWVFVSSNTEEDIRWCGFASEVIGKSPWPTAALEPRYAVTPLQVAAIVSQEFELTRLHRASLIADLTLGPKDRSAAIYVASSALQSVTILYAERQAGGFRHREVTPIGDFNAWLSRHGVLLRDYKQELANINTASVGQQYRLLDDRALTLAISDMLTSSNDSGGPIPGPRANLLTLMEAVRESVWSNVMGRVRPRDSRAEDEAIRDRSRDEWHRSAGRAAQALWLLRALFAHGQPENLQATRSDAIAALDLLSFLSARLKSISTPGTREAAINESTIIIALDGDDVGRRFEEYLARCSTAKETDELVEWSHGIQSDISLQMLILQDRWEAVFLARTGDGFLARLPASCLNELSKEFRPALLNLSATVGVGPAVKDAYLALKLGKARNRGGGLFYSVASGDERVLWPGSHNTDNINMCH